jgi:plastocyanin
MQNRNILIGGVIGLVIALALGFYLLGQNKAIAPTITPSPEASVVTEESASPSASESPDAMTEKQEETVTLGENGFSPKTLTIKKGTTVTWVNESGEMGNVSSAPHPIHTSYPPLNLGNFADGNSVSLTFDEAGTYNYHHHLNPSLTGTVIVQ